MFQPTRPHGARQGVRPTDNHGRMFQPTRPHGARRSKRIEDAISNVFQPTRPHGARRRLDRLLRQQAQVSTHAPARGATATGPVPRWPAAVSTHAPARGATGVEARGRRFRSFQPTRPHGARLTGGCRGGFGLGVSTHAPARGATWASSTAPCTRECFNPRARTGRDQLRWEKSSHPDWFQPTRPHGARLILSGSVVVPKDVSTHAPARGATGVLGAGGGGSGGFNPRARTGRDGMDVRYSSWPIEFQPTRPHGARLEGLNHMVGVTVFQPTRPHGARPSSPPSDRSRSACFNPRARTGRDGRTVYAVWVGNTFQPTRPHGARLGARTGLVVEYRFQPTRPHGARRDFKLMGNSKDLFQPTRPHGARRLKPAEVGVLNGFQPTRPHGARQQAA